MTCQIVIGGDESGCTIPYAENLQGISTEIKDGLAFDFEPVISSAPKHAAVPAALRPMAVRPTFSRPPACRLCSATTSMTRSRQAATRAVKLSPHEVFLNLNRSGSFAPAPTVSPSANVCYAGGSDRRLTFRRRMCEGSRNRACFAECRHRPISVLPGFGPFVSPAGIDLMIESLNVDDAHSSF